MPLKEMNKPEVVVLCCGRTLAEGVRIPEGWVVASAFKARIVRIPCSSKLEVLHLLQLFEHGADGVLVVACSRDQCQFLFGSACIEQRVKHVRRLLEEIGLEASRLSLISRSNLSTAELASLASEAAALVGTLSPNPMKKSLAGGALGSWR